MTSEGKQAARRGWWVLGVTVLLTASCAGSSGSHAPGKSDIDAGSVGGVVLKPSVVVLTNTQVAAATVAESTISFPAAGNESLATLAPGTVIVSGYGRGFIRRVQSVATHPGTQSSSLHTLGGGGVGSILLSTVSALLTDAILSGSFDWTYAPTPLTADATEVLSGSETAGISVTAQANISPTIEVKGQITDGSVSSFETILTTTVSDTFSESVMFDASHSWSGSAAIPGASTTQTFVEFLGPVPVVGTLTASATAGYSASISAKAHVSIGETCSLTHSDTLTYDPEAGWSSDDSSTSSCTNQGPTLDLAGMAGAQASVSPSLHLSFYGVGGPSLSAQVGAEASITACPGPSTWSADAFVSGTVGANVSVLGISKQFSKSLGKATYPIANGDFDTPSVCADGGTDGGTDGGEDGGDDASDASDAACSGVSRAPVPTAAYPAGSGANYDCAPYKYGCAVSAGGESASYSSPPVCGYTLHQVYAGTNGGPYTASLSCSHGGSVVSSCEWSVGPSGTCDGSCDGTLGVVLISSTCGSEFACPPQ